MRIGLRKRTFAILLAVISIITTIIVSSQSRPTQKYVAPPRAAKVVSLNELISNDMSEFEQTEAFDKRIEAFMRRWEMTGATFAIMRNDSLLYAKGYGYANKEAEIECDASHLFRIASVSKLITATAVMKLIEDGKLSLGSKVFGAEGILNDSIFMNFRGTGHDKITVEHLLRHTSGIYTPIADPAFSNYSVARSLDKSLPLSVDDMIVYATSKCRVRYKPGGRYDYSNLGYIILGKVIERVSGEDYEDYVRSEVLAPAGCYNMFIGQNYSRKHAPNEVRYYEVKEAEEVEAFDGSGRMVMKSNGGNNVTLLGSAGGWVTSSVELLRFVASIDNYNLKDNILSAESIATMTNSRVSHPIGWASISRSTWLRSGSMAGTSALIKHQSNGYTWVFIVNNSAWIGPKITRYISSQISSAVSRVKEWPKRDLFELTK